MSVTLGFGAAIALAIAAFVLAVMKLTGSPRPLTEVAVMLLAIAIVISRWN